MTMSPITKHGITQPVFIRITSFWYHSTAFHQDFIMMYNMQIFCSRTDAQWRQMTPHWHLLIHKHWITRGKDSLWTGRHIGVMGKLKFHHALAPHARWRPMLDAISQSIFIRFTSFWCHSIAIQSDITRKFNMQIFVCAPTHNGAPRRHIDIYWHLYIKYRLESMG